MLRYAEHLNRAPDSYTRRRMQSVGTRSKGWPKLRWKGIVDGELATVGA